MVHRNMSIIADCIRALKQYFTWHGTVRSGQRAKLRCTRLKPLELGSCADGEAHLCTNLGGTEVCLFMDSDFYRCAARRL